MISNYDTIIPYSRLKNTIALLQTQQLDEDDREAIIELLDVQAQLIQQAAKQIQHVLLVRYDYLEHYLRTYYEDMVPSIKTVYFLSEQWQDVINAAKEEAAEVNYAGVTYYVMY